MRNKTEKRRSAIQTACSKFVQNDSRTAGASGSIIAVYQFKFDGGVALELVREVYAASIVLAKAIRHQYRAECKRTFADSCASGSQTYKPYRRYDGKQRITRLGNE